MAQNPTHFEIQQGIQDQVDSRISRAPGESSSAYYHRRHNEKQIIMEESLGNVATESLAILKDVTKQSLSNANQLKSTNEWHCPRCTW